MAMAMATVVSGERPRRLWRRHRLRQRRGAGEKKRQITEKNGDVLKKVKHTKPPFSYYGGKQRMASKIVALIPRHAVYVEPFAGGAAVFFRKPTPEVTNGDNYREVLNDLNGDVVNFFTALRDDATELKRLLELTPYSREEYRRCNEIPYTGDATEDARRFFVRIVQSFGSKIQGGWGRGKQSKNDALSFNNAVDALGAAAERLRGCFLESVDALQCIDGWDTPQTFFYCDPPYVGTAQGHYSGYTEEDLLALCQTLDGVKGSFILSSYGNSICDSFGWEKKEFSASSSVNNVGTGKGKARVECVWMRGPAEEPSEAMRKILRRPEFDVFGSR